MDKFEFLQKKLNKIDNSYRSIPFWSFNNSLEIPELLRQIEDMKSCGMGGFIMHARTGLKEEYLGEKWFSCISACLKKAKELGMDAWIYDENGWPSGFVGGKLLENQEFKARYLECEKTEFFDGNAFCVYVIENGEYKLVDKKNDKQKEYFNLYLKVSDSNTDILNPDVVNEFISHTHEQYYKRFKSSFGKELKGFFTDEPQYYRWGTPYNQTVIDLLVKKGFNVKENLIYLFNHDKKGYEFRHAFYSCLNELYVNNYYKRIYEWCDRHNCMLTGHTIEETSLGMQMMCCAGAMPTYEYEHIPAIDMLTTYLPSQLMPKQIGSVSSQLNKKHVLTETFAASGNNISIKALKHAGEYQYFNGVNKMCQHLYPYSLSGQGKTDYPPCFSKQANWFSEFKDFNEYFARLGYIIANTKERVSVGIIHPIKGAYLDYVRAENSVSDIDNALIDLLDKLNHYGIPYHFIDESILYKHGKNVKNALKVGKDKYSVIIIPKMNNISKNTYDILRAYNGKLFLVDNIKYVDGKAVSSNLKSNITFEEICGLNQNFTLVSGNAVLTERKGKFGEFIFVKNLLNDKPSVFNLKDLSKEYSKLDLESLTLFNVSDTVEIAPMESVILYKTDKVYLSEYKPSAYKSVLSNFAVKSMSQNSLVLDKASISKDGQNFGEYNNIQKIFEELLREDYKGKLFVRQKFNANDVMPLTLLCEKEKYQYFTLNGKNLNFTQSDFDINFIESDITQNMEKGQNVIEYCIDFYMHEGVHYALFDPDATEGLKNCLYFDCSLENMIIRGDFVLDDNYCINAKKDFKEFKNITENGYPFFYGSMTVVGNVDYRGGQKVIKTDGDYLVAKLKINKKELSLIFNNYADITDYLVKGNNQIEITVKSSLRNLFGPHHYNQEEGYAVSPECFTFMGEWKDGVPKRYTEKYMLVPFGINDILIG